MAEAGYEPALEHEVESRFAVGNGFLGVRGSLEQPTQASRPRTFIAGMFTPSDANPPVPSLVYAPDWLPLRLHVDGRELSFEGGQVLEHSRTLDFRRGLLLSSLSHRSETGVVVRIDALRFAAFASRATAVQVATIEVEQPSTLELEVGLAAGSAALEAAHHEPGFTIFRITGRPSLLTVRYMSALHVDGRAPPSRGNAQGSVRWSWPGVPGRKASLSRIIEFASAASFDLEAARVYEMRSGPRDTARRIYTRHLNGWQRRWSESDVTIAGDDPSQEALRFAVYHLISAANPENERASVGARALTGDAYKGHVFWDTEIFLLPFYTFTWPAAARAMLMYRYHTLPAARAKAENLGYRGALYAWESADTGEETTPPFALGPQRQIIPIRSGVQEHHISADIAYAVWQYWQATGDSSFLLDAGAEILLETARFWATRARLEEDGRYHIRGVIGPDEYHEGVDDNAFTNVMAAFNIECATEAARILQRRWPDRWAGLKSKLSLTAAEMVRWSDVQAKLITGFDPQTGLFEQFAGFFSLEEVDLEAYADRTAPMDVVLGPERTRGSQIVKQADVVMLLALLGSRYDRRIHEANLRYYEPRTGHGSSLSPPAHAVFAARLGEVELAKRLFDETAAIDLDDTMGNAAGGVHIGALGGLWQAAVLGFGGLCLENRGLRLDPHLPQDWQSLSFPVQWRRRLVKVKIESEPARLSLTLERGRPMSVHVGRLRCRLSRGETWRCSRRSDGEWQEADHGG